MVMPGTRYPNANFANGRKLTRITVFVIPNAPFVIPNTVRNLASKREEILRFALNDKRLDADMNIPPSPPSRGKAKRSVGKTGTPLGGGLKA